MSEKEKVSINKTEYRALNQLRGLPEAAHYMVILAEEDRAGGYILEGTDEAFDGLASYINEEIAYELSPKSRIKTLRRLYDKVAPQYDDF